MSFFGKLLQKFTNSKDSIVFVQGEYYEHCQEFSRDSGSSNYYHYTKPSLIITKDKQAVSADDIIISTRKNPKTINGVKGEYHDSYPEQGVRNREYILYISEEACPLRIMYSSGSGESHKDSEFWSSEHKDYWVRYLRERGRH